MVDVYVDYPRGHYLSDGAYKEVHKVYSTRDKRLEAVSVMDIGAIASTGNQVRAVVLVCERESLSRGHFASKEPVSHSRQEHTH